MQTVEIEVEYALTAWPENAMLLLNHDLFSPFSLFLHDLNL